MKYQTERPVFSAEYSEDMTVEDLEAFHRYWLSFYEKNTEAFGWVLIVSTTGTPKLRAMVAEHAKQISEHMSKYCRRQAIVAENKILAGAVTAVIWLQRPSWSWKVFSNKQAALAWVQEAFAPPDA